MRHRVENSKWAVSSRQYRTPEEQRVVLIDAATLREAERLIESGDTATSIRIFTGVHAVGIGSSDAVFKSRTNAMEDRILLFLRDPKCSEATPWSIDACEFPSG